MSADKLPPDATLTDLTGPSARCEEFVRRVLANFYAAGVDRNIILLRIGVQGSGSRPNYRFETPHVLEANGAPFNFHTTLIYNGANHETMSAFEADRVQEDTWSKKTMAFAEVEARLGKLRKIGTI